MFCAKPGSVAVVAGCIFGLPYRPLIGASEMVSVVLFPVLQAVSQLVSDQPPPVLPATMPAVAAAGPNTDVEPDLFLLFAFSGLGGNAISTSDIA